MAKFLKTDAVRMLLAGTVALIAGLTVGALTGQDWTVPVVVVMVGTSLYNR